MRPRKRFIKGPILANVPSTDISVAIAYILHPAKGGGRHRGLQGKIKFVLSQDKIKVGKLNRIGP